MESNETYRQMQNSFDELKTKSETTEKDLKEQIENLSLAKSQLESQAQQGLQAIEGGAANAQQLEIMIVGLKDELKGAQERQIQIESELQNAISVGNDSQAKYERELALHAQTANAMTELRNTVKQNDR